MEDPLHFVEVREPIVGVALKGNTPNFKLQRNGPFGSVVAYLYSMPMVDGSNLRSLLFGVAEDQVCCRMFVCFLKIRTSGMVVRLRRS